MDVLVCSVCGSANWREQQASVDSRYPIAKCLDHRAARQPYSPLMPKGDYQRRVKPTAAPPEDVFGALPEDDRAALAKPVPGTRSWPDRHRAV